MCSQVVTLMVEQSGYGRYLADYDGKTGVEVGNKSYSGRMSNVDQVTARPAAALLRCVSLPAQPVPVCVLWQACTRSPARQCKPVLACWQIVCLHVPVCVLWQACTSAPEQAASAWLLYVPSCCQCCHLAPSASQ
jgi:hypothetical protein